jgi:Ca2+-binding RTX toxin-like protein
VYAWGPIEDEGDRDVIYAGTGNDFVESGGGDDEVHAGTGDDIVFGDPGDDWIEGGDGDDILDGDNSFVYTSADQQGSDYIDGGSGNDEIWGEGGGRARVRSIKLTLAPMRQRLTMACPGDVYHITSGGNEKKAVIRDTYVRRTSSQYLC